MSGPKFLCKQELVQSIGKTLGLGVKEVDVLHNYERSVLINFLSLTVYRSRLFTSKESEKDIRGYMGFNINKYDYRPK